MRRGLERNIQIRRAHPASNIIQQLHFFSWNMAYLMYLIHSYCYLYIPYKGSHHLLITSTNSLSVFLPPNFKFPLGLGSQGALFCSGTQKMAWHKASSHAIILSCLILWAPALSNCFQLHKHSTPFNASVFAQLLLTQINLTQTIRFNSNVSSSIKPFLASSDLLKFPHLCCLSIDSVKFS